MPVVEITVAPGASLDLHYVEPNRVIDAGDLNRMSGQILDGSLLEQLIAVSQAVLGNLTGANSYLGLRLLSFSGPGPETRIRTQRGVIVAATGVYRLPDLTVLPAPEAHVGFYEIELAEAAGGERGKQFYSVERDEYESARTPTSWRRYVRVFENYSSTSEMPATTPGRVRWLEYRKNAAFQQIVSIRNHLARGSAGGQFPVGFLATSLKPGDGNDWLTCTGEPVPTQFQDLINHLREVATHPEPLNISSVQDNGGGLCRVNFSGTPNLYGLRGHPDARYVCLEVLTSDNATAFGPGIFKVKEIGASHVVINRAFPGQTHTGTAHFRPYAIADEDGGGARTPSPDFVRFFSPAGNPRDAGRLPHTFQTGQNALHDHGGSTGSGSPHGHALSDPGHAHNYKDFNPETPGHGDYAISTGPSGTHRREWPKVTDTSGSGISLGAESAHIHAITPNGGADVRNPDVPRPDNLSLYLLVKT